MKEERKKIENLHEEHIVLMMSSNFRSVTKFIYIGTQSID